MFNFVNMLWFGTIVVDYPIILGFEIARSLALHGCKVILACRDVEKAQKAIDKIQQEREHVLCEILHLDLCSLHSVREAAAKFKQKHR